MKVISLSAEKLAELREEYLVEEEKIDDFWDDEDGEEPLADKESSVVESREMSLP